MTELICMRGYPGSGKTTAARSMGKTVISRDDLRRAMFDDLRPGKDGEDAVTLVEEAAVKALLKANRDVVVDAMHVNPRYLRKWAKLAARMGVDFRVVDVRTSVDECVARDDSPDRWSDGKFVGESVIRKIAKRFPMERWPDIRMPDLSVDPYVPPPDAPYNAVIVDIDGTLAHMTGRSPYDYSRVHDDTVDHVVRDIVNRYSEDHHVLVVSGRDPSCREETLKWLQNNDVTFDQLLMRPEDAVDNHGNKLPDWQVKLDLFNRHIRHEYNVKFVIDDRQQVVDTWRRLGLKCLQPQEGDF